MESLYTKYRPQTFDEVVGQQHVVATLTRAVLEGRTSHAYLFCGPRGTGKTTMARILAKALVCESGPGALPDGTCEQCRLIAAGEHPDVIELDAASRTGVDNVRDEIISRVDFAPTLGRAKVYIIDEVHMLTTAAFNALLKTLEEPPAHVVFVMCTTDPQKILPTILSRVQRFDFKSIGSAEMRAHLVHVCEQEGFAYEGAALDLVVRHARGGMRDALTTLEQLSVFGGGEVTLAAATDLLGEVSADVLGDVVEALARRDVPALFARVADLADGGRDLLQFVRELAARLRDVYVVAVAPGAPGAVAATGEELERLRAEAAAFGSADRLARALAVLADASAQMRTATNQRLVLEVALTRLARPETELTLDSLAERVEALEQRVAELERGGAGAAPGAGAGEAVGPVGAAAARAQAPVPVETNPPQVAAPVDAQVPGTFGPSRGSAAASRQGAPASREPAPARQPGRQPAPAPKPVPPATQPPASPRPVPVSPSPTSAPRRAAAQAAPQAQVASGAQARPAVPAASGVGARPAAAPAAASSGSQAPAAGSQAPAAPASYQNGQLQRAWKAFVDELVRRDPARGALLSSSRALSDDGEVIRVELLSQTARLVRLMLERPDVRKVVDPVLAATIGPRRLEFVAGDGAGCDAAAPSGGPSARPAPATRQAAASGSAASAASATPAPAVAAAPAAPVAAPVAPVAAAPTPAPPAGEPPARAIPAGGYPMPWEAPAEVATPAAPAEPLAPASSPDDVVPYEEAPYEEVPYDYDPGAFERPVEQLESSAPRAPAPVSAPAAPARADGPAPVSPAPGPARPRRAPTAPVSPAPTSAPVLPATAPAPASAPAQPQPAPDAEASAAPLTDEFATIKAMLEEAFGSPIKVSVEPATDPADEAAAAELAYDVGALSGAESGYVADPDPDSDDYDD